MDERTGTYSEDDFVKVVDKEGKVLADPIPKAWIGTELAPDVKQATKAQVEKTEADGA